MNEINKPANRKYWYVTKGTMLHNGITEPNQVTSSGFTTLDSSDTMSEYLTKLQLVIALLPPVPNDFVIEGKAYVFNAKPVIAKITHERRVQDPDQDPDYWEYQ